MVLISADAGGVAQDLKRIDPCLHVRFAENGRPPFWAVYWEAPDGSSTYLVTTVQAHQTVGGIWTGLDQRLVRRIEEIDPQNRSGYNYARELEKAAAAREEANRQRFRERIEATGEVAAFALRKDLGVKNRIFVR